MFVPQQYQVNCFVEMGMKAVLVLLSALSAISGLNIKIKIENNPECKFKGQQCNEDLSEIILCTSKGGNSNTVAKCESGTVCTKEGGVFTCSKKNGNQPNVIREFNCQGEEIYPDANKCNTAYVCESKGSYPALICECPDDSALVFCPGMTCSSNEDIKRDCMCPSTDRCKDEPGRGDFGMCHSQFFYDCRVDSSGGIVPHVFKCPTGTYYNSSSETCESATASSQTVGKTGKEPICREYMAKCFLEEGVKCSKSGELLPHRKIDRCYYKCDKSLKPLVKDCGRGSYFSCINGQCGCLFRPKSQ